MALQSKEPRLAHVIEAEVAAGMSDDDANPVVKDGYTIVTTSAIERQHVSPRTHLRYVQPGRIFHFSLLICAQTRYGDAFASSSNHRRSDAFDESGGKGSLLSRMTKDGQPVAPKGRSLASRITRDTDDSSFGRLRDDDAPQYADFSESAPKRGLADRITRDDDEFQIRGRGERPEGINIRGTASQSGFSIRGVAGGV